MIKKIIKVDFNQLTTNFYIKGQVSDYSSNVKILIRRFIEDKKLVTVEPYYFDCKIDKNIFEANINLSEALRNTEFSEKQIFDCYIQVDDNEEVITIAEDNNLNFSYGTLTNSPLYQIKPYVSGRNNTLSIFVNNINISSILLDYKVLKNNLYVNVDCSIDKNLEMNNDIKYKLLLKERAQIDLFEYGKTHIFNFKKDKFNTLVVNDINLEDLILDNIKQNNRVYDLFLQIEVNRSKLDIPIKFENGLCKIYTLYNKLNNLVLDKNINNGVCIKFEPKKLEVEATDFEQYDKGIKLKLDISTDNIDVDFIKFVCKKRYELRKYIEYYDIYEQLISNVNKEIVDLELKFSDIMPIDKIKENDVYDLFIRIKKNNEIVDIPIKISQRLENIKNEYLVLGNEKKSFKIKSYVNANKNISIYAIYNNINHDHNIKIAVFGSCFSRSSFTSTQFFNHKYKEIFKVVQTDFHASIISAVSDSVDIEFNKIDNLNSRNVDYIYNDFNKSIFDRTKQSNPDYMILDFYADAAREIIYFDKNKCVSGSLDLRKTKFYKELKDINILEHTNNEHFFEVWKKSLDIFMEKMKQIIPEENIILARVNFIEFYKTKDNTIKEFSDIDKIKRNKYLFDKMNNYYLHKYTKSPVIDLRNTKYIGIYNHPLGNTYSHYESGYYKEFMGQLERIVLLDLLKKNI